VIRRLVAILAVALVLTGCAQLPRTGAIGVGPNIELESEAEFLYYSPSAPSEGDSQQQILSGFLSAGNGPQNDYSVARSYLTPAFQPKWQPSDEVLVQDGIPQFTFTDSSTAVAEIKVSATIDSQGVYQAQPEGTKRYLNFKLSQQNGEWRISSAPNLTVLIRPNFTVLFKPYQLYFFDNGHRTLVPDVRWFPSRTSTATHLVQALLVGPQSWMSPALARDFPAGTTLNIDSVTVVDGVATVDLSDEAFQATDEQRQFFKAQIKATLLQIPSVTSIEISINKSPQTIPELKANIPNALSATPVTLDEAGIFGIGKQSMVSLTSPGLALVQDSTDFALSPTGKSLGLLSRTGIYRISLDALDKSPKLVDSRSSLVGPQFDNLGYLWSVASVKNSTWKVFGSSSSDRISAEALSKAPVQAFAVSPDGARVAILFGGSTPGVWLHSVVRDVSGRPTEFGPGIKLDNFGLAPLSLSWVDAVNLAVLLDLDGESARPIVQLIGGETRTYPSVTGGTHFVANLSGANIFALRNDGRVYQYKSNTWLEVAADVRAIHLANLR
jgi:hypothetical protein